MPARLCGAAIERDKASQARCWCRGLFCGKGGRKLTTKFRHVFKTSALAMSGDEFTELVAQADLLDGDSARMEWIGRVDMYRAGVGPRSR